MSKPIQNNAPNPAASNTHVYIFGSDKGGVGKTMAAQACITRLLLTTKALPVIVEIETDPRLSLIYGKENVNTFRLGENTMQEMEDSPKLIYKTWNGVANVLMDNEGQDIVLDLGANLTKAFMSYLNEFGADGPLETGQRVRFHAVATGELTSITGAENALRYAERSLPNSTRILLLNKRDEGRFPMPINSKPLLDMATKYGASAVEFPNCGSEALAIVTDKRMRLDEAIGHDFNEWIGFGLERMEAKLAARRMSAFGAAAVAALGPVKPAAI